jgi:hypothetical protein
MLESVEAILWSRKMPEELKRYIESLEASIGVFDKLIPVAEGLALQTFLGHRAWHLQILASLSRLHPE